MQRSTPYLDRTLPTSASLFLTVIGMTFALAVNGASAAEAAAEPSDPVAAWKAKAPDVEVLISGAVSAGVGQGRHEPINVQFGGASTRGKVVAADDNGIRVELRGVNLSLAWDRLTPQQYVVLGRAYLPDEGLAHGALAQYCAAYEMLDVAEEEVAKALNSDVGAWSLVREVNDYLKEKRRSDGAARSERRSVGTPKRNGASEQPEAPDTTRARSGGAAKAGKEHPYLYFDAKDIPALRARAKRPAFAKRTNAVLSHARKCLNKKPWRGRGMQMTRPSLGIAINTAFAYVITGEKQFAERAIAEGFNLLDGAPWNPDHHANTVGADLASGEGSLGCAIVYDWCYTAMSEAERKRFREGLLAEAIGMYSKSIKSRDWWVDNYITNWNGVCHGGCGLAALVLYHEDARAREAAQTAWKHTKRFIDEAVLEDGGGHEGVMYHHYGIEYALYFAAAHERSFGGGEVIDEAALRFAGYWDVYMQGPDLAFANFNDMSEGTFRGVWSHGGGGESGPRAASAALFDSRLERPDALLLWAADNGGCKFMFEGSSPFPILFRRESAPPVTKKPALEQAVLFRGAGHAVWHSPTLWFAFNGGWISDKSHNNCDLGSFVLVAGNHRLVNDPGYGKKATKDHSTIVIDGKDQREGTRGTYLRYGSGRGFHYLACDLSDSYTTAKRVVRHAVMVGGHRIVLLDDITAAPGAKVECRVQTTGQVETTAGSARAVIKGSSGGNMSVVAAWPKDIEMSQGKSVINYLRIAPRQAVQGSPIVTILTPGAASTIATFEPSGSKATLRIADALGRDELVFARAGGQWLLSEVNGQSARSIGPPATRIVKRVSP